jgi:hypothetical protein
LCAFAGAVGALPEQRLRHRARTNHIFGDVLELSSCYASAVRLHVTAAGALVRRGVDRTTSDNRGSFFYDGHSRPFSDKGWHAPAGRRSREARPLARPGRSAGKAGGCPNLGPGRRIVIKAAKSGVSRFAGQAGSQARHYAQATPEPRKLGCVGHNLILPADSFRLSLPGAEADCWEQISALCPASPTFRDRGSREAGPSVLG